jgi:hypothetical protein
MWDQHLYAVSRSKPALWSRSRGTVSSEEDENRIAMLYHLVVNEGS